MRKTFKYRIYANSQTVQNAEGWLELCRQLYNTALEQRKWCWEQRRYSISKFDQNKQLPVLKVVFPEFKQVGSQVLQGTLIQLDKAFQAFFCRVKRGETPGYPRFKGKDRYKSFTLYQYGYKLEGNRLTIRNVGTFRIKLSRPIEGRIKTVTIKRARSNKWFVYFSCDDVPSKPLPKTNKQVGVDVGCESFLTTSEGQKVENSRFFKQGQELLARRQQALSRKKKGSSRRQKARLLVAKAYEHIANQRRDFHFKVANQLIKENDIIYIEKMNSWNTEFRSLNKSMNDTAWFQFFDILRFKAEEAGREVVEVPAKNTSQLCSQCGVLVPKDLSVRIHNCARCGFIADRDHNASLNILRLGQSLRECLALIPENPQTKGVSKLLSYSKSRIAL